MWNYYYSVVGVIEKWINFKQNVSLWRNHEGIDLWFLRKIRNTLLYGGSYDEINITWKINDTIIKFFMICLNINLSEREWVKIVNVLQRYRNAFSLKVLNRCLLKLVG